MFQKRQIFVLFFTKKYEAVLTKLVFVIFPSLRSL
nr:MAG TPA: hypothetical protein [Caudoviricetes sp.]